EELLGETSEIISDSWQEYAFNFMPSKSLEHLLIEVFYAEKPLFVEYAYNGHVLIDDASLITQRSCTQKDTLIQQSNKDVKFEMINTNVDVIGQLVRKNVSLNTVKSITLRINRKQSIESVIGTLQKKFDELDILDDSQLLISVLVSSKEDRIACKKLIK
ncbi:MAG: hypothetical protein AAFY41_17720, partial [Bacteroidota bacterium]